MKLLNKSISKISLTLFFWIAAFGSVYGQCGGFDLKVDDSAACVPQILRFEVTGSLPVGTTYKWDFGSGFNPGADTASHLYLSPGFHDVKVELSFPNTTKCIIWKKKFIEVGRKPIANITLDKNVFCGDNDSVFITDLTPKSKSRDYIIEGIKYTNLDKVSVHKFSSTAGSRDISVVITDSIGCEVIDNFVNIINIPGKYTFDFSTDSTNGCTNRYANFKYIPQQKGQEPKDFEWFFDNATPFNSVDTNPENIFYSTNDSSDVTLRITTKEGCTYSVLKENYITLEDPIALQINVTQTDPCVGEYVSYDISNSQNKNISWQFFPDDFKIHGQTDTSLTGEHRTTGGKVVRASQVYKGCLSQTDSRNKVNVKGPESRFSANKTISCFSKDTVIFTNNSIEPAGEVITYKWYIKDNAKSILDSALTKNFTYIFNGFGNYTITLICYSNVGGCSDTLEQEGYIQLRSMEALSFADPKIACVSQVVTLRSLTPQGSNLYLNKYRWNIYDDQNNVIGSSTADSFDKIFIDEGVYSYSLTVFNDIGCLDSVFQKDSIRILKPTVSISYSDSSICKNQKITFDAEHDEELAGIVHYWYFTNTTFPGTANNVALLKDSGDVTFRQPGTYTYSYSYYARVGSACKDTFTDTGLIKVSGTELSIATTKDNGCDPLNTDLTSSITKTQNYKNIYPAFSYQWKASDTFTKFNTPTLQNTNATITGKGIKRVRLVYTDKSGCMDSTAWLNHYVGVQANFATAPQACLNGLAKMTNTSSLNPTTYKWYSDSSSVIFLPDNTSKDVNVKFTELGRFPVTLIASKDGCSDTITRNVTSVSIKAKFYSPSPVNQCAPVVVEFIDSSNNPNITKRYWDFGDGEVASTGRIVRANHVYLNNTDTAGIDISLIVENNYGCIDTLNKKGYVKVLGPIPSLHYKNASGCEPLKVEFINESKYFSRVYLEYGDGYILDSTNTANHTYRIIDDAKLAEFFHPKLVLYDVNGCFVEYTPEDSIYVVQNAIADYEMLQDTGCETFKASFINKSRRAFSYSWDFDNDGNIDNIDKDPFAFYNAGKHYPTLIAKSPTNCYDTLKNHIEIYVHAKPNANFVTLPDTACYEFPVFVEDKSSKGADSAKLTGWFYDFGEELKLTDTSSNPIASNIYNNIGNNLITFTVTDENGCVDSAKKFVHIRDTLDPDNYGFSFITVNINNDLELSWNKSKLSIFRDYHIYNDEAGVISNIYNSSNINDTSLIVSSGVDVNSRRYCYATKMTDTCLRTGPITDAHCNIYLRALDTFLGGTQLRWSHYEGWLKRWNYEVYRKHPDSANFIKLATLRGNENVYIDDSLCEINYCYYVICTHPNLVWKSQSNTACNTPQVAKPKNAPIVDYVTVRNNKAIQIKWHMPPNKATLSYYTLYKNEGAFASLGRKLDTSHFSPFWDTKVDADVTAYTYRISTTDICGNSSDKSIPSHSIFLEGINKNDTALINWNPYTFWSAGVKEYLVQMRDNNGEMNTIDQVASSINSYSLNSLSLDITDSLCFRVIAIEDSTVSDSSYSNIGCIAPKSRVYVPNSFSPNDDGINESFKPVSLFLYNDKTSTIYDYSFEVFSRWGEKLYSTNDVNGSWDGTYLGKPVPSGLFIWRLDALGLDGVYHTMNGKVTLLR